MKENIRAGRNEEALKLADCLNPAAVRSNSDLTIMSDLYLESGMLAKAGACLDELYSRKKTRSILMQLINLSVRLKRSRKRRSITANSRQWRPTISIITFSATA
jgi:hypothetical protein